MLNVAAVVINVVNVSTFNPIETQATTLNDASSKSFS